MFGKSITQAHKMAFLIGLFSALSACLPSQVITATPSPTQESSPEVTIIPTDLNNPSDQLPTITPTTAPTLVIEATLPPLSNPSYTHMGLELVGSNFLEKVPMAADAGAGWIRWNGLAWARIEPQEGTRDWGQAATFESYAQAVSDSGMRLITIVRQTPEWAQAVPGYSCGAILPEKLAAFGQFMHDLVLRYSQPPYNVKYWELGNEPDIDPKYTTANSAYGCWGEEADPYYGGGYYAEMLKIIYPQIKAADPDAEVLIGGLLMDCDPNNPPLLESGEAKNCLPARFMEGILIAGGGPFFDGISFHAYDYYWTTAHGFLNGSWGVGQTPGLPVSFYKTVFLRDLLSHYGFADKYLLNTETALLCGRENDDPLCQTEEFNKIKANYVVLSYVTTKGEGLEANIWYHYQQGWRSSGLVSQSFQTTQSLTAYRFASQILEGVQSLGKVMDYPNVIGYKFLVPGDNEGELWVIWSADGTVSSVTLPLIPAQLYDPYGQPLPPVQTLEITAVPIYILIK